MVTVEFKDPVIKERGFNWKNEWTGNLRTPTSHYCQAIPGVCKGRQLYLGRVTSTFSGKIQISLRARIEENV